MDVFTSVYEQECISPDEAAQVIVAALADPTSVPLACIDILLYSYGVLSRLWNEPEHDHRHLFRRYRYVLRCTMRFLCSFRSVEQFRVLKQTLERGPCRCARGPEALHKLISPSRHRNLLMPGTGRIPRLVSIMSAMLSSTIARQGGLQTLYRAARRSLWPTSMNDFVHGGSTSLHNLVRWLPQMDADTPYQETCMLICNVFEAMPSYLRAGFIKGPMLVDWLHHTMTTWTMQPIEVHADLPLAMESTGPLLESARNLSEGEIFLWLSGSPRHTIHDMFTALDRAFTMLTKYPSHAASYEQVKMLREPYKLIINYMVHAHQPDLHFIPSMYTSASDQESLRVRRADPVMRLARTAFGSSWSQRCYGPGCIATYADRSKTFKRCSGCCVATYCSRKCQKAAWRHPTAAHREVCGLYRACKDAMLPYELDINEGAERTWGALPRQQLDAASANIENLRATQLVCLKEEMDSIPTDEL